MTTTAKVAIVAGGYILAALLAAGAVWIRVLLTSGPVAQASSGMYAFGDCLLFAAILGGCALLPTGAALYFLRPYARVWRLLAALCLTLAATGIAAMAIFAAGRHATTGLLAALSVPAVLRILMAPMLAMGFLLCALFAPDRGPRLALFVACALDLVVCACGALLWLLPMLSR